MSTVLFGKLQLLPLTTLRLPCIERPLHQGQLGHRIMRWQVLTVLAVPYYGLQSTDELGKDRIDVVESCEQNHDVGTRLRIPLGEEA